MDYVLAAAALIVVFTLGWSVLKQADKVDEQRARLLQIDADVAKLTEIVSTLTLVLEAHERFIEQVEAAEAEAWKEVGVLRAGGEKGPTIRNIKPKGGSGE